MNFRVAAVQMNSGPEVQENLKTALSFARQAKSRGASVVAFPEHFLYRGPAPLKTIDPRGPEWAALKHWTRKWHLVIVAGSTAEPRKEIGVPRGRPWNVCRVLDRQGQFIGVYKKIHLFNAQLAGDHRYRESQEVTPGRKPVVVRTPFGVFGLSICYDLRFPELYRRLALQGAEIFFVPANFTAETGKAHWEILVRARAIENTAYVVAPAQGGTFGSGRRSHGHSLIVDPWGRVLARAGHGRPGLILADIKGNLLSLVRKSLPVLRHVRLVHRSP